MLKSDIRAFDIGVLVLQSVATMLTDCAAGCRQRETMLLKFSSHSGRCWWARSSAMACGPQFSTYAFSSSVGPSMFMLSSNFREFSLFLCRSTMKPSEQLLLTLLPLLHRHGIVINFVSIRSANTLAVPTQRTVCVTTQKNLSGHAVGPNLLCSSWILFL